MRQLQYSLNEMGEDLKRDYDTTKQDLEKAGQQAKDDVKKAREDIGNL